MDSTNKLNTSKSIFILNVEIKAKISEHVLNKLSSSTNPQALYGRKIRSFFTGSGDEIQSFAKEFFEKRGGEAPREEYVNALVDKYLSYISDISSEEEVEQLRGEIINNIVIPHFKKQDKRDEKQQVMEKLVMSEVLRRQNLKKQE